MAASLRTRIARTGSGENHEPDVKIVFAVLAIAMLVGALLTTPSRRASEPDGPPAAAAAR